MFETLVVNSLAAEVLEPLGSKSTFWYSDGNRRMLFKAEERGTGEDWAERVACELAAMLGLPHVHYELAYDQAENRPGVVCETCAPQSISLVLGNQLLLERDPAYPAEPRNRYKVRVGTEHHR